MIRFPASRIAAAALMLGTFTACVAVDSGLPDFPIEVQAASALKDSALRQMRKDTHYVGEFGSGAITLVRLCQNAPQKWALYDREPNIRTLPAKFCKGEIDAFIKDFFVCVPPVPGSMEGSTMVYNAKLDVIELGTGYLLSGGGSASVPREIAKCERELLNTGAFLDLREASGADWNALR